MRGPFSRSELLTISAVQVTHVGNVIAVQSPTTDRRIKNSTLFWASAEATENVVRRIKLIERTFFLP